MLSIVLLGIGAGIVVSAGVTAIYGDADLVPLLFSAALTFALGLPIFLLTRFMGTTLIGSREGFVVVAAGWVVATVFGAVPYVAAGVFGPIDALFETMSGFTTTGASVLVDYGQPHGIVFWRSLTHWYGGMGIIVLFLAILPSLGGGGMRLFSAESPGPVSERLTPKIRDTARGLWIIYVGLSVAEVAALLLVGMGLFDAVTHSFGTMATGRFSPLETSIAAYHSWPIEAVITVFMALAGANFAVYFAAVSGDWRRPWRDPELRAYLAILGGATVAVTASLMLARSHFDLIHAFREAAFQVVSIQTTTGFVSADFDVWNTFARTLLIVLMFVGGCAGSTAGGDESHPSAHTLEERPYRAAASDPSQCCPVPQVGRPGDIREHARRGAGILLRVRERLCRGHTLGGDVERWHRHCGFGGGYLEQHRSRAGTCRRHPQLRSHQRLRQDSADQSDGSGAA